MKDVWKTNPEFNYWKYPDYYRRILTAIADIQFTAKDVEEFSLVLEEYQQERYFSRKASLFLSALINSGKDSHYIIHTQHLAKPLNSIGFKNEKDITVDGNTGNYVGDSMEGGTIIVNGDAKDRCGFLMRGGSITVDGDVGNDVAWDLIGGRITINGNAGNKVGIWMNGGEIRLEGEYESLSYYCWIYGGRIYHKGELIFPK
jgi:glutamate synthase domain-containing protein 3